MQDGEIARITTSPSRRIIGVASMAGLGGLLLYLAINESPALGWQLFLIALGIGALWLGQKMWQATALSLILTEETLTDSEGTLLARIDEIEKVDRGLFAMKPSNGFTLLLSTARPRIWRPGLWWRIGRRVAIGGVTAGSQTKPVADILSAMVAQRTS